MTRKVYLDVLVGLLFISGFVMYIGSTFRSKTQPVSASWLIWFALDAITFAGMFLEGSLNGQIVAEVAGSSFVMILALRRRGFRDWKLLDKYCLGGGALGLVALVMADSAKAGIMISQGITLIGSIPTFGATWKRPSRENKDAWMIFWLSSIVAISAVPQWTLSHAMAPIVILTIDTVIPLIIITKPLVEKIRQKILAEKRIGINLFLQPITEEIHFYNFPIEKAIVISPD